VEQEIYGSCLDGSIVRQVSFAMAVLALAATVLT
jgi:hypothetical protein